MALTETRASNRDSVNRQLDVSFGRGAGWKVSPKFLSYDPRYEPGYMLASFETQYTQTHKVFNDALGFGIGLFHMRNLFADPVEFSQFGGDYSNRINWNIGLTGHATYTFIKFNRFRSSLRLGLRGWYEDWMHSGTWRHSGTFVYYYYTRLDYVIGLGLNVGLRQAFLLSDQWGIALQVDMTPFTFEKYIGKSFEQPKTGEQMSDEQFSFELDRLSVLNVGFFYTFPGS